MLVKRLLQLNTLVSAMIAVTFIALPEQSVSLYGTTTANALRTVAQYFGATHVAFAVLLWLALRANDSRFLRAIVTSFFAGDLTGTVVLLFAQLRGAMGTLGWGLVALSFLFAVGYGYGALKGLPASE
jgi:hypothetical protein